MGDIIDLQRKLDKAPDNVITWRPFHFRRSDWGSQDFLQMSKSQSAKLEAHRQESYEKGEKAPSQVPPHFTLKGGMAFTIRALYVHRNDEGKMREVYYLTGLMDCMINQVNPILRTDLLRDMYKKVFSMKEDLRVNWYGPLDQVLLPIDTWSYDESVYRSALSRAHTMKGLYQAIREGTEEMFDILAFEYVFYCPGVGG
jgi:hypothetical protein